MMTRTTRLAAVLAMMIAGMPAHGHYLWLDRDAAGAVRAYFGEWEDDLREPAGGHLDLIKAPLAFHDDRSRLLVIARQADHLSVVTARDGDVRLVEEGFPAYDDKRTGGRTKPMFHAREGRIETAAALGLELVPIAAQGNVFVLLLRGAPVAKEEVKLFGPPRRGKTLHTDAQGRVALPTPWAGRYVVEIAHIEACAGGAGADSYDRIRHVSTLSFVAAQGLPWAER